MPLDLRIAIAALALTVTPLAATAHHRDGHSGGGGNGHSAQENRGGGGSGLRGGDENESEELEEDLGEDPEEATRTRPCANGLAGREVACMPPGQARRGVTTEQWIGGPESTFTAAQDLTAEEEFGLVVNADRLGLPALSEGQIYAVAGDALVVVNVATAEDGTTTYTYDSTVRRAAFPGSSND